MHTHPTPATLSITPSSSKLAFSIELAMTFPEGAGIQGNADATQGPASLPIFASEAITRLKTQQALRGEVHSVNHEEVCHTPREFLEERIQNSAWSTWHHYTDTGILKVHESIHAIFHISGLKDDDFIRCRKGFRQNPMSLHDKSPEKARSGSKT